MKKQVKTNDASKWSTTEGSMKPVKLSEIKFVNKPRKK